MHISILRIEHNTKYDTMPAKSTTKVRPTTKIITESNVAKNFEWFFVVIRADKLSATNILSPSIDIAGNQQIR